MDQTQFNVLFVEPSGAGGIAHYTYQLAKALVECNVGCTIITSKRWNFPQVEGPYQVFQLFNGVKTPVILLLKTCISIRHEIDIVHWQSTTHPILMLNLMRVFPVRYQPWVWTVHNVLPHEKTAKSMQLYKKIYQFSQGLIFHTQFSYREYQNNFNLDQKHHAIIPIGEYGFLSQTKDEVMQSETDQNILFFGNIRRYKGLDILLEAMPKVLESFPKTKLIIAGQALEPFEYYQAIIEKYQLQNHLQLQLGYVPDQDIDQLFAQAQIVALPYRAIDQSAVLLLAMSLGKTVIASDVGGISEVIEDGNTGFLVEAQNSTVLAEKILDCLNHPELCQKMGHAARIDVQNRFSWDTIAKQTIQFYQDLIG